jgi:hypothetical protein
MGSSMAARLAIVVLVALVAMSATDARAADYYVSPTGSDSNPGTEAAPFASWSKAQSVVAPGDTVYFRGGRFRYTDATSDCAGSTSATVNAIVLSKSGSADKPIHYWAYPGEKPIFDFSGITNTAKYNCRQAGVRVTANYLHLKGLEFTGALQLNNLNHESWCVYVFGGSHNLFELLDAHHNMGPGFFIQRGSDNTFLNCDSHENEDTLTSNGDGQSADGFGCHPNRAGDTGNVFRGCRAWWNTDDGWDFIHAAEACTVEHSWAWYNGYKPDAVNNGQPVSLSSGNGNGFKGGGYGLPPADVPAKVPQHVLRFNLALFNKAAGFYANHSPNSPIFHNNTGYKNGVNFNLLGVGSDGSTEISVGLLRNNLAFGGTATSNATLNGPIDTADNSWDAQAHVTVANADFQSVTFAAPASCPAAYAAGGSVCVAASDTTSFAGLASARLPDGSLPALPLLHLAETSMLIDRGQDVGLPFVGKAPDLGAFEYGSDALAVGGTGGTAASGGRAGATALAGAPGGAGRTAPGGSGAGPRAGTGAAASPGNTPSGDGAAGTRAPTASPTAGAGMPAADGGTSESAGGPTAKQASGCGCQFASRRSGGSGFAIAALFGLCVCRRRRSFNSLRTPHARLGRRAPAQVQA